MNAAIDISQVQLCCKRLILRPWLMSDLDDLYEYAHVDGVGQMAGWAPHASREESRTVLERFIAERITFALELRGKVIGSLGIETYDTERFSEFADKSARELGFVLSRDWWGQGLMVEAVEATCEYLFEDVGLDLILCGHFLNNKQSQRVQEKCGFEHYAFGDYTTRMGTVEPEEERILTKEAWLKRKAS